MIKKFKLILFTLLIIIFSSTCAFASSNVFIKGASDTIQSSDNVYIKSNADTTYKDIPSVILKGYVAPTPPPIPPKRNITICIDPGHGGYDSGAVGPTRIYEKDVNLRVGLKLGEILKKQGINVIYTRTSDNVSWTTDINNDLQTRCDIANNAKADYYISIHCNSATTASAYGQETFIIAFGGRSEKLAQSVQKDLSAGTGLYNRGVKQGNLYVLRNTNMPAILVELAFISNYSEEKLLNSDSFENKCAQSIANGINKYIENN